MTNKQIATILNETIVPNALGADVQIAEDLSDVSQIGIAFKDLTIDDLKSYMGDLAVGVWYDFINSREFREETYGMYINAREYGGVMGRIRAKHIPAFDSPITTLESYLADSSAPDYNDGHYYGAQFDSEFFVKDVTFMIPSSISIEYFRKAFMTERETQEIVSVFRQNAENSAKHKLNELARANLRMLIKSAYDDNRYVDLITEYNTLHGFEEGDAGEITIANWNLSADFKLFCQEQVINLKKYMQDLNNKYNDGTIETFATEADTKSTLLTAFSTALDFNQSAVYHQELTDIGEHYTTNFWQNPSDLLIPQFAEDSVFDSILEDGGESEDTAITKIAGVIYTSYSAGITEKLNKITSDYIAKGDFVTNYHHLIKSYFVDTRESAIVLRLA